MPVLDPVRLDVERLGRRGEGVARHEGHAVYLPYALPGESVLADLDGERGHVLRRLVERPDRVPAFCPYYERCGGCAVQTLPPAPYAEWKRGLVVAALDKAGLRAEVAPLVDAHGTGRRRVTFHASPREHHNHASAREHHNHASARERQGHIRLGFMAARSHAILDIAACPVLDPALAEAAGIARRLAEAAAEAGKPLDILLTATDAGIDVDLRGLGRADDAILRHLVVAATACDLARLSNHGRTLVEARAPALRMGRAVVLPPPGSFLQPTAAGEAALAALVRAGIGEARRVADLFCGLGTFALPLADGAAVSAWDGEPRAVAALLQAAHAASGLRPVSAQARDLFARPLLRDEMAGFDALVFDPPRAGAAAQSAEIARSQIPTVVAVSCDPGTFARDAAILAGGGYGIESVTPVDQFRHAAHVEIVAVFRRARPAPRKRRLLS